MDALKELRTEIDVFYGPPLQTLSNCIRGFFIPGLGNKFIVCDFSSIEARVIAWLAGQEDVLETFRGHGKIYEHTASGIYRVDISAITKEDYRRQVGKVAVLSLGFQGGVGALQKMARGYNVKLEPIFEDLWARASTSHKEKALEAYKANGKKVEISREEYLASSLVKLAWRESNPRIVEFWPALEEAAKNAVAYPGEKFTAGKLGRHVTFLKASAFLWCKLPSGRTLCYPSPKIEPVEMPWKQNGKPVYRQGLTYMTEITTPYKWDRVKTYGGSLAENVTQAVARDLFASAMVRLEKNNYPIVLHIHDEFVLDVPNRPEFNLERVKEIMCENPPWAKDLPLAAGGFECQRYRK